MVNERYALIGLALIGILASILACNAPTETPAAPTEASATPPPEETVSPSSTETPSEEEATLPPPTATKPSSTPVLTTPTATIASTVTPLTPTVVPTQLSQGEPLMILDPGFTFVDHQIIPDSSEWEGHLRVQFTGGVPPYTFALESGEPQSENYLYIRWRQCRNAPLTVHVWSADGQEAHKQIWVESPHCP